MQQTTVNYSDKQLLPRKNGTRRDTCYAVTYGCCGTVKYMHKQNAEKAVAENRRCEKCHCNENYEQLKAKYGVDFLVQKTIERQLANPSKPEKQIMVWLDEMGVNYLRQQIVKLGKGRYVVDFLLADGRAIEGTGGYWHPINKADKDVELAGILNVLFVDDDLTNNNPVAARAAIAEFVGC